MGFIDTIIAKAKANRKTIVLPEASDRRVLEAAARLSAEEITNVVLIGDPDAIRAEAAGLDLTGVRIVNPLSEGKLDEYTALYYEMRKKQRHDARKSAETMKIPCFTVS